MTHIGLGHMTPHTPQTAFKCYVRTRDYCTTSRHVVAMCLAVIRTALELGNFVHVANYVSAYCREGEREGAQWGERAAGQGRAGMCGGGTRVRRVSYGFFEW